MKESHINNKDEGGKEKAYDGKEVKDNEVPAIEEGGKVACGSQTFGI